MVSIVVEYIYTLNNEQFYMNLNKYIYTMQWYISIFFYEKMN